MTNGMTLAELLAMPVTVDITTASRALGLGRSTGYELPAGRFPVPRAARRQLLPRSTAELLRTLGIDLDTLHGNFPAA